MDALLSVDHRLEVPGEFFGLEELLGIVFFGSNTLVFDAVDQGHALTPINDLRGEFNKLLWVAFEIIEPSTVDENAVDAATGE